MTQIPVLPGNTPQRGNTRIARCRWTRWIMPGLITVAAACGIPLPIAAATPAAGDTYVYRLINGYNHETIGHINHEFTAATTAQGSVISVTVDKPSLGLSHTEIQTRDGQWLRHHLDSHGLATEYEFAPALPALLSPLAPGKSWSVRVNAKILGSNRNRSVRIDGEMLGNERIRVPAGEFDTVKIRRTIYAGDAGDFRSETRIVEIDWYAPALGRSVRSETRSGWRLTACYRFCDYRGDWNVLELTETHAAKR